MMKKFFALVMTLALCMAMLSGRTVLAASADAAVSIVSIDTLDYLITINGSKGTVTRQNNTGTISKDMYIRYAVNCSISGDHYLMIDLIDVKWDDSKKGISGTFSLPKIQIIGEITNECFMLTTDEMANTKPINEVFQNTYGLLTR